MDFPFDQMPQFGALAIFVWYTIQNNREWRLYLTERNSKLEKALDKLSETLARHNERL